MVWTILIAGLAVIAFTGMPIGIGLAVSTYGWRWEESDSGPSVLQRLQKFSPSTASGTSTRAKTPPN